VWKLRGEATQQCSCHTFQGVRCLTTERLHRGGLDREREARGHLLASLWDGLREIEGVNVLSSEGVSEERSRR